MNLDSSGLETIYTDALSIGEIFREAIYTLGAITLPTSSSAGYVKSVMDNLLFCCEDSMQIWKEIKAFKNDLERTNTEILEISQNYGEEYDKNLAATAGVLGLSGVWGLSKVGEAFGDFTSLAWSKYHDALGSIYDWLGIDSWAEAQKALAASGMEYMEKDLANYWYYTAYQNNQMLKDMNNASYAAYDGTACQIVSGMTYYLPMRVVDGVVPGLGMALSGMAAAGKEADETLTRKKNSSWDGIKDTLSEEEYESCLAIRNMTDEEYRKIYVAYANGQIAEEQFQAFEAIRNMPEKWTTSRNLNEATYNATGAAVWEAGQYALDGVIDGIDKIGGSELAASALRVGTNGFVNSADTLVRAGISSLTSGESFWDEFNYRGGVATMGGDFLFGAGATSLGELGRYGVDWLRNLNKNRIKC